MLRIRTWPFSQPGPAKRGFSLVEIAIVLGIVGIILGGVWKAAYSVEQTRKVTQAVSQLQFMVSKIRTLYPRGVNDDINQKSMDDISPIMFNNGVYPAEMGGSTKSAGGKSTWVTQPVNPWGGYVRVDAFGNCNLGPAPYKRGNCGPNSFEIEYFVSGPRNIPCEALVSQLVGQSSDSGLIAVYLNNDGGWIDAAKPDLLQNIHSYCTYVSLAYSLK